ncbi:MAG: hypothetical protein QOI47_1041, partial [Actinomycetota bacterium]|nr:hypothetical protein [Actinomycetota bacterium]
DEASGRPIISRLTMVSTERLAGASET